MQIRKIKHKKIFLTIIFLFFVLLILLLELAVEESSKLIPKDYLIKEASQRIIGTWRSDDDKSEFIFTESGKILYSGYIGDFNFRSNIEQDEFMTTTVQDQLHAYEKRILKNEEFYDTEEVRIQGEGSYHFVSYLGNQCCFKITFNQFTSPDCSDNIVEQSDLKKVYLSAYIYTSLLFRKIEIGGEGMYPRYHKIAADKSKSP